MIEARDSQAQLLSWQLKEEAWAEVAHLPLNDALSERLRLSAEMTESLGLAIPVRDPRSESGS